MQINPAMLNEFLLYSGTKTPFRPVPPSTLAHRIVYVEAKHKGVDFYYLDNGGILRTFVAAREISLVQLEEVHGAGLLRISRSILVNPMALTGVFPLGGTKNGCSTLGSDVVLSISRRCLNAVKFAYKGASQHAV